VKNTILCALASTLLLAAPIWAETDSTTENASQKNTTADYPDQRIYFGSANPASFSFYGTGRLQIPSLRFDAGSSLAVEPLIEDAMGLKTSFETIFSQFGSSQSLDKDAAAIQTQVESFLTQFQGGARLGYDLDYNILGFAGAPLTQIQIADRPLSLGLHLGANARGYLEANFSEDFTSSLSGLTSSIPSLVNTGSTVAQISNEAGTLVSSVNSLNNNINEMVSIATTFFDLHFLL